MFLNAVCAGALLLTTSAFAQAPGGGMAPGGHGGAETPPTVPNQQPGANSPMGTNNGNSAPSKVDDKKFAKDAALGGMTEVELGKLAAQKASNNDVKQFAQKMVDDHTKANDQLKQIAAQDKIQIPDSLDSKHQSRIDKLSKLSGEQFDKAYVKDQLKDHETDVKDFNAEAQNGSDPNIKAFASSTLPVLQQHLDLVKNLNKSEKQMAKNQ
jgi:putative membrane protein